MKPGSELLRKINAINLSIPVKNIVAVPNRGNGLAGGGKSQNDGTIPVASARALPNGFSKSKTIELPYGHSEIMQTFDLVEQIRMFVDDPLKDLYPPLRLEEVNRGF
jgi:hypothetical protein